MKGYRFPDGFVYFPDAKTVPNQINARDRSWADFLKHASRALPSVAWYRQCSGSVLGQVFWGKTAGLRILHCFGGTGTQAALLDSLYAGLKHTFWGWKGDPAGIELMEAQGKHCLVVEDAWKSFLDPEAIRPYDYIAVDSNAGTLLHPGVKAFWAAVASSEAKMCHLVDSAIYRIHLNGPAYTKRFGRPVKTINDYIQAYDAFICDNYGWRIVNAAKDRRDNVFLLCKRGTYSSRDPEFIQDLALMRESVDIVDSNSLFLEQPK